MTKSMAKIKYRQIANREPRELYSHRGWLCGAFVVSRRVFLDSRQHNSAETGHTGAEITQQQVVALDAKIN